ncbi:MAG: hypothetical protein QXW34_01465, partial [Candidatus Methanomethyliaceae archaeon]
KDLIGIAIAHGIPYAATASPSFPLDLMNKVRKGLDVEGPALIHVLTPCTTGWRFDPSMGIEIGKLAVLTGLWPLYEVDNGVIRLTLQVPRREPVKKYLELQGRFRHLTEDEIIKIQEIADKNA